MTNSASGSEVKEFYNKFSSYQKKTGINIRIRSIFKKLKVAGLKQNSNVLEIGCGTGTLTSLLSKHCSNGKIISTDISNEGIEKAKLFTGSPRNVEFRVADKIDFDLNLKFDFVIFADVLEHIPIDAHSSLLASIKNSLHSHSIIAVNIPSPFHIEWQQKFQPEVLQVIDQPLHTNNFLNGFYTNGLYLFSLETYSLYFVNGDYQWMIFKLVENIDEFKRFSPLQSKIKEAKSRLY